MSSRTRLFEVLSAAFVCLFVLWPFLFIVLNGTKIQQPLQVTQWVNYSILMSKLLNFAVCTNANFANGHIRTPLRSVFCHSERSFRYFWLDPKVTKKSRLRALHTPSRRSHAWKSGNSLRFGQPDFLSPCSLFRRLTARGPRDGRRGRSRRDSSLRSEWQTRLFALIFTRLRNSRSDTV